MIKNKDFLKKLLGFNIIKISKVLNIIALIMGAIAYAIISKIIDKILMTFLPLKKMNSLDEFWLYDDKDSLSNVSALFTLEKTKFEVIQNWFYNEFCSKLPKTKCKLVKIFGKYYWKEMGKEEFDKKFPEIIIKVTGIHDKETLYKFMLEKINTELDLYDNVAYKFWVFEDYAENESLLFGI